MQLTYFVLNKLTISKEHVGSGTFLQLSVVRRFPCDALGLTFSSTSHI